MTIIQSLILGLIQGITEFLPISSTAHLILAEKLMHISETDFVTTFDVAIQAGSAIAVLMIFWKKLLTKKESFLRILVAFIPTMILGLALHNFVKSYLYGNTGIILAAMAIGGLALILLEQRKNVNLSESSVEKVTYKQSFIIGLCQSLALVPGVSRSAASIGGGLLLGLPRETATEFSFMLAIPTLFAATALDVVKNRSAFAGPNLMLFLAGFAVALVSSLIVIRWLLGYVKKNSFTVFGVYRIVAAVILALVLL